MLDPRPHWLNWRSKKVPLFWVLVIPFVLQTVGAVSLVGYLSFQSGHKAVENLASRMMTEVGARIGDRLDTYLQIPHHLVAVNRVTVEQRTLDPSNLEQVRQQLWQQFNLYPLAASNFYWSEQGEAIGYGRVMTEEFRQQAQKLTGESITLGTIYLQKVSKDRLNERTFFLIDDQGKPRKKVYHFSDRFQTLPWYLYAKKAKKQTWTPIFLYRVISTLGMQASAPIYDASGQLQVLFTSSFSLTDISQFLHRLHFSPTGQAFILERSGYLVATSTLEKIYIKQATGELKRVQGVSSKDAKTQEISQRIAHNFVNFQTLQTVQQLNLNYNQQRQFVRVIPYRDRYGLDWLIVIIVPESDFMGEIQANIKNTIFLCIIASVLAIVVVGFTTNLITRRIAKINRASQAMAAGTFDRYLDPENQIQELGELARSFNQMAAQLRQSFNQIQLALEESKEKFTTIFRTSPDPIVIITLAEERILEVNESCIDFFGYSRQELIGQTIIELGSWGNLEQHQNFRKLLLEQLRVSSLEVELYRNSGEICTVLLSAEVCNLEGQDYAVVMLKDISARKQVELALQESEQRLEAILDSAPLAIFIKDLQGRYIRVNPAYERMTNLTQKQLLGITDYNLLPLAFAQICWESDQIVLREKLTVTFEESVPFPYKTRYLLATKFPLLDLTGRPYAVCGIAVDISARKQAEAALRESEERFRTLFENSPIAYFSLNSEGHYIDVNSKLCDLLGYSREELLGQSFGDFWPESTKDSFPKRFAYFKSDGMIRGELQLMRKDRIQITALLEGRVQHNTQGEFVKTHCILYNITERKRMEEALRQTKAKLQQTNQELEKLVNLDALTQVANRRCFANHLQQQWQRLLKEQQPLSLILFDVDYFKRYNDRYGHPEGDECLIKIAQAAQHLVYRPGDLVARYGGEEFIVILPHTNQEGAISVAERIRFAIHALSIPHAASEVSDRVTISLGIASVIPFAEADPEMLIEQADRALYLAKQKGRDRFAVI